MGAIALFVISFIENDYPAYRQYFEFVHYFLMAFVVVFIRLFSKRKFSMRDLFLSYLIGLVMFGYSETLFNDIGNYNIVPALAFTVGFVFTMLIGNRMDKGYGTQG
ncbi:hypothetical protein CLV98_106168 [Dyadobacter jejuensis]|uniref:Uncharacterized protein n=1 Tax=Dyadobacter jejuensis TaxID=1082580 RepID=A0A316AJ24_9BACT|nr:hypothetical protein [Dyadobacter jejuensis]PWJ57696.1 hypothetical protein CLV98_106168 [Dyadobacter jejuensis]